MDFIHLWHEDRTLSKILRSTIPIPVHGLKVKVTDFCVKCLQCQFLQSLWLIWIMFGMNRYKILKCFIKEKRNCRRAALSGDRSYYWFLFEWWKQDLKCLKIWSLKINVWKQFWFHGEQLFLSYFVRNNKGWSHDFCFCLFAFFSLYFNTA